MGVTWRKSEMRIKGLIRNVRDDDHYKELGVAEKLLFREILR
jgi:hypothetical protein